MCVGFYTEKGLDESLATMNGVQPSQIMENDWYWHRFLREARGGVLDEVAENVVSCSSCAVRLMIEIYAFNRVPIPGVTVSVDEYVELKLEPSTRTFMVEVPGLNTLARFNNCSSIRNVAERLQTDSGLQFFWVDLHIEIHLAYGSEMSGSWGAAEIWENSLAPWGSWVE